MLFIHTLDKVLSGEKVQTSRIWKDNYLFPSDYYDNEIRDCVLSRKAWDAGKIRHLYRIGQILSCQPARGAKGVAKILITELARRDVRDFSYEDIVREGFGNSNSPFTWFFNVWADMHDKSLSKTLQRIGITALSDRPSELYTALVIRFELVKD